MDAALLYPQKGTLFPTLPPEPCCTPPINSRGIRCSPSRVTPDCRKNSFALGAKPPGMWKRFGNWTKKELFEDCKPAYKADRPENHGTGDIVAPCRYETAKRPSLSSSPHRQCPDKWLNPELLQDMLAKTSGKAERVTLSRAAQVNNR